MPARPLPVDPTNTSGMIDNLGDFLLKPGVDPVKGEDVSCGGKQCYTVVVDLTADELATLIGAGAASLPVDVAGATLKMTVKVEQEAPNHLAGSLHHARPSRGRDPERRGDVLEVGRVGHRSPPRPPTRSPPGERTSGWPNGRRVAQRPPRIGTGSRSRTDHSGPGSPVRNGSGQALAASPSMTSVAAVGRLVASWASLAAAFMSRAATSLDAQTRRCGSRPCQGVADLDRARVGDQGDDAGVAGLDRALELLAELDRGGAARGSCPIAAPPAPRTTALPRIDGGKMTPRTTPPTTPHLRPRLGAVVGGLLDLELAVGVALDDEDALDLDVSRRPRSP